MIEDLLELRKIIPELKSNPNIARIGKWLVLDDEKYIKK